jgi:hypothetical protein
MQGGKAIAKPSPLPKLAAKVSRDLQREHERELKRLSDIAFAFLLASDGNIQGAENLLDGFVDLICESGVLSMWRYRIVLDRVREGL